MKPGGMRIGLISGKFGWEGKNHHTYMLNLFNSSPLDKMAAIS